MLRTFNPIRRHRISAHANSGPAWRSMRLTVVTSAVLLVLLATACGSSSESTPASAPTVGATSVPEPTSTPEPTAVPTPEYVPGPREATFADGRFKVNFLYRSEPDLAQAIDVVDVESILGPFLERIVPALGDGVVQTINFKGPITAGLHQDQMDELDRDGYAMLPIDVVTFRIEFRINPNGIPNMEDFWRVTVPSQVARQSVSFYRLVQESGTWIDSVLDIFILNGTGEAFRQELFPDHEAQLRELSPEVAAVIYDLTPDGESELWAIAEPVLNAGYTEAGFLRFFSRDTEFPDGTNEAIGLRIVEAYLENNPDATASSLIKVAPEEIYEGSNYSP